MNDTVLLAERGSVDASTTALAATAHAYADAVEAAEAAMAVYRATQATSDGPPPSGLRGGDGGQRGWGARLGGGGRASLAQRP